MASPQQDEYQSEEHTTEVGEMGDAIGGVEHAEEQLEGSVEDHEPFGFDGKDHIEIDLFVGEHHAESQEDAIDGSRGSDGGDGGFEVDQMLHELHREHAVFAIYAIAPPFAEEVGDGGGVVHPAESAVEQRHHGIGTGADSIVVDGLLGHVDVDAGDEGVDNYRR